MKWLDTIKEYIPMEDIHVVVSQVKKYVGTKAAKKDDPALVDAENVMKRIHYLLEEKSSLDLGKQEIYKRNVKDLDGIVRMYTYMVDFNDMEQIKRLRTVLLELADLTSPDATKAKKESVSGYLDYIAQASL